MLNECVSSKELCVWLSRGEQARGVERLRSSEYCEGLWAVPADLNGRNQSSEQSSPGMSDRDRHDKMKRCLARCLGKSVARQGVSESQRESYASCAAAVFAAGLGWCCSGERGALVNESRASTDAVVS